MFFSFHELPLTNSSVAEKENKTKQKKEFKKVVFFLTVRQNLWCFSSFFFRKSNENPAVCEEQLARGAHLYKFCLDAFKAQFFPLLFSPECVVAPCARTPVGTACASFDVLFFTMFVQLPGAMCRFI